MALPRPSRPIKQRRSIGQTGYLDKLLGKEHTYSNDLMVVAFITIFTTFFCTYFYTIGIEKFLTKEKTYNSTSLATIRTKSGGKTEYDILVITDLDHDSKSTTKKNTWESIAKQGVLTLSAKRDSASVKWDDSKDFTVSSQISAGGRAMELSDLVVFDGRLLTIDDRTGIVYELKDKKAIPWLLLNDGPGNVTKGIKGEWMTVRDDRLYVGGLGKEWTTTTGEYVNDHPMWVKEISATGEVKHVNFYNAYVNMRKAYGIEYPGYMIHESVQFSKVHRKWFFLPRRASNEKYDEAADETRGANVMIIANEFLTDFQVVEIGKLDHPARGFSAFQFIPNTNDKLIVALKSEEKDGKPIASFLSVFDITGKIILDDTPLHGAFKFEGIAFV